MKFASLFITGIILAASLGLRGQSSPPNPTVTIPPRIFFSDLDSGPNIGGQKNHGVWVTIWGKGFGAARDRSTVTIGGGGAAEYPIWTDTRITFQLGPATKSGPIIVNLKWKSGSGASNGLPFTVRPGKIYFVAVNGSDWRNGSFQSPWKTITYAKDRMSPGDVTYIRDGVAQTSEDNF